MESDPAKLRLLYQGEVPIHEPGLDELVRAHAESKQLCFTDRIEEGLAGADFALVAVGTPARLDGRVDLSALYRVSEQIVRNAVHPITVVMKSTVPPGTGRALTERFFSKSATRIRYASNPEFLREGQAVKDWFSPDRIVVGSDDQDVATRVLALYAGIQAPKIRTSVVSAEMIKYAANAFLATKISFINEIATICELVGADVTEVAPALGMDVRIGSQFLRAGIGYGGSCFPKDTKGLEQLSSLNGYDFALLKAVIEVNRRQRISAVRKLRAALGGLLDKRVAVLGLAFKPGTDDVRESPAIEIISYLVDEGAAVSACDPVAVANARTVLPDSVELFQDPYDAVRNSNAVLLATEWDDFTGMDWTKVKRLMAPPFVVFDGRNALARASLEALGFRYSGIGRQGAGDGDEVSTNITFGKKRASQV